MTLIQIMTMKREICKFLGILIHYLQMACCNSLSQNLFFCFSMPFNWYYCSWLWLYTTLAQTQYCIQTISFAIKNTNDFDRVAYISAIPEIFKGYNKLSFYLWCVGLVFVKLDVWCWQIDNCKMALKNVEKMHKCK